MLAEERRTMRNADRGADHAANGTASSRDPALA